MNKKLIVIGLILVFMMVVFSSFSASEPVINSVTPTNDERIDRNPVLSVNVSNDKLMDIVWFFNDNSVGWEKIGVNESVDSGVYRQIIPNGTKEKGIYQWRVNISDEESFINQTYNFSRMGWYIIGTYNFSFGNKTIVIKDISFSIDENIDFNLKVDLLLKNFNKTIYTESPNQVKNLLYSIDDVGVYRDIELNVNKSNPHFTLLNYYYSNYIEFSSDGEPLYFENLKEFDKGDWTVQIIGEGNKLEFRIYPIVNPLNLVAILFIISIIILYNLYIFLSNERNDGEKKKVNTGCIMFALSSIIIPFLLSEKPIYSLDIRLTWIFSIILLIISGYILLKLRGND